MTGVQTCALPICKQDDPARLALIDHDPFVWEAYTKAQEQGLLDDVPKHPWEEGAAHTPIQPNLRTDSSRQCTRTCSSPASSQITGWAIKSSCNSFKPSLGECGSSSTAAWRWALRAPTPTSRSVTFLTHVVALHKG